MAASNWDWVFHTLGWILAGVGLLLALWALFWDRSRGRKRCPKCWYSMEGAAEHEHGNSEDGDAKYTCPECGQKIVDDRALHGTRRWFKRTALGTLVCLVGYGVFVTPAVRRDGWIAITPTTALVIFASPERIKEIAFNATYNPYVPFDYPIEKELIRRGEERSIYNWQADLLAWRLGRARNDAPVDSVFKSHDITTLLSPAWWSSSIPFNSDDIADLSQEIRDLFTYLVAFDGWADHGGDSGGLLRMGARLFVWVPRRDHEVFELVHTLLTTKGQGDVASVRVPDWYWWNIDDVRHEEIRMYDVTDLAPPSVTRFEMPPPDPNEDIQWGHRDGELAFDREALFDLADDITMNVRMYAWVDNGGESASMFPVQGWLIIQASPELHSLVAERIELHRAGKIVKEAGTP